MYNKIIVPLDGSVFAERALPYAVNLAQNLGAHLALLSVANSGSLETELPPYLNNIVTAKNYLNHLKKCITDPKSPLYLEPHQVDTIVEFGDRPTKRQIAEKILDVEKNRDLPKIADLVVMTTHCRGISEVVLGSVATSLLEEARIPVVLIQPVQAEPQKTESSSLLGADDNFNKTSAPIIVTLDGSSEAETALEPAVKLALELHRTLYLLYVIEPLNQLNYAGWPGVPNMDLTIKTDAAEARQYLDNIQKKIAVRDLKLVKTVCMGEATKEIIAYTNEIKAAMVIMATHGRGRVGRTFLGSVATDVVRNGVPVLVVHREIHNNGQEVSKKSNLVITSPKQP